MKKLLVIVGPTGVGKTKLGIKLAKQFNGEIISADSRQIYKNMDIGTGKEVEELRSGKAEKHDGFWTVDGVKINLYDILDPKETFSVADFQQRAYEIIHNLQKEDKLPVLVGGTGLYVSAVVDGLKVPKAPPDLKLRAQLEDMTLEDLQSMIIKYDPASAKKIDMNNPRRIIRALEVFITTGKSFVGQLQKFQPDFDILQIGLTAPREWVYERVDKQTDKWFDLEFVDEVKELLKNYSESLPSMTSIGYRQVVELIKGNLSEFEARQRIKFDRHGYIRRQLSWFRRDKRILWFDASETSLSTELEKTVYDWYNTS